MPAAQSAASPSNLVAIAAVAALCAFIGWQLWMGLAKGRMLLNYVPVERSKGLISFWLTFAFWALVLSFLAAALATYLWSVATGHR